MLILEESLRACSLCTHCIQGFVVVVVVLRVCFLLPMESNVDTEERAVQIDLGRYSSTFGNLVGLLVDCDAILQVLRHILHLNQSPWHYPRSRVGDVAAPQSIPYHGIRSTPRGMECSRKLQMTGAAE